MGSLIDRRFDLTHPYNAALRLLARECDGADLSTSISMTARLRAAVSVAAFHGGSGV